MKSIDIFPWSDNFNTDIEAIDTQHKKLVELLNRLATEAAYETNIKALNKIFDELIDYTIYHFKTEEELWSKYLKEDPLEASHKAIHQKFIDKIVDLKAQQKSKPLLDITEDALEFLAHWLASHILETDRENAYIVIEMDKGVKLQEAKKIAKEKVNGLGHTFVEIILDTYSILSKNALQLIKKTKQHKKHDKEALYEHKYRQLLLELSTSFINIPLHKLDKEIDLSLEKMAAFVGADRAYVFDYDIKNATTSNTHEWCQDGITAEIQNLQNIPIDSLPDWYEKHKSGNYILIQDVAQMQEGGVKEILLPQGVQSIIALPLFTKDECSGFVGFDAVRKLHTFLPRDITILNLFSKLISNVYERKEVESRLFYEKNFLKTLVKTIPDLVWIKDTQGNYLECNGRFEEFFGAKESEIIGKTDYDFVSQELADFFRTYDNLVMQTKRENTNEELITFASDGHTEVISTKKVPMYDENKQIMGVLGIARDITQEKEIQKSMQLAASVFTHSREGIIITSSENIIIDVNQAVCEISGYSKEELLGKNPNVLNSGHNTLAFYEEMWSEILKNDFWSGEIWNRHKNGTPYAEMLSVSVIRDSNNQIINYLAIFSDITTLKKHQKHLEYIAHYDALTGLPNRVLLADRLKQLIAQTQRKKESLAVVYLDLDGFKEVNDTYGHEHGDKLLTLLAQKMKNVLRDEDTIARIGGDEFVAVLSNLKTNEDYLPILQDLLLCVSQAIKVEGIILKLSASLGVTFYTPGDEIDPDQLLRHADQAMYKAKLAGKNRYHIFDLVEDESIRIHHEQLDSIEKALVHKEFLLYYQPKVNMRLGKIIGFEALIRWNHPQNGILAPSHFLPVIEEHPLSIKIGEWVLEEACKQILLLKERGFKLNISVNINALQLLKGDFIKHLSFILKKYPQIEKGDLIIEILETSALEDLNYVSNIIEEGEKLGVKFSLDDFGTGYSSLTYLKRLSVGQLKIDQTFIHDMLKNSDDLAIIQGVITLSNAFHKEIVAEGIEKIEHGEILLQLGCDIGQGYFIAKPMPKEKLLQWIEEYKANEIWKKTKRISMDNISYLYAMAEHTAWLKSALISIKTKTNFPLPLHTQKCQFGVWITHQENKEIRDKALFEKMKENHENLHKIVNDYIFLKDSIDNSTEYVTLLSQKSDEILAQLKKLSRS